ncbi:MAG: ABC transporter permease, partial [Isosphaeraceae bacterium]
GLCIGLVTREFSGGFAEERERGTLDALLTTRLSSFEIVSGKLFAGLFRVFSALSVGLPPLILIASFGGTDFRLSALALGGVAATVFFLGTLTVAFSAASATRSKAQTRATLIAAGWLDLPFLAEITWPRLFPNVHRAIRPLVRLGVDSSPIGVLSHVIGLNRGSSLDAVVARMIALELLAGAFLWALACFRLRAWSRAAASGAPGSLKAKVKPTAGKRLPCGDDPMDWKERHAARVGTSTRIWGVLIYGALFAILGYTSFLLAQPAWREVVLRGYRATVTSDSRSTFNQTFLRPLSTVVIFAQMAVVAGITAESLDLERKRGTWLVLLSTPLTGREILGAKSRASRRRTRVFSIALVCVWILGAVVGSVHPLGLALAVLALLTTLRFCTSLGSYSAVRAAGVKPGANLAMIFIVLGMLTCPVPVFLTGRPEALPLVAFTPPISVALDLITWDEVQAAVGSGVFGGLTMLRVPAGPGGAGWLVAAAFLGPVLLAVMTRWMDREVDRLWDVSVGRPVRESPRVSPATTPAP